MLCISSSVSAFLLVQNTRVCFWRMTGRWLTTELPIPRILNSTFSFFFVPTVENHIFFSFYCNKVDQIKSSAQAAKFLSLSTFFFVFFFFDFSQMISCICFPAVVSCLAAAFVSLLKKKRRNHKVRSYQSCSLLNSNKLAVTFWVHCFHCAAGLSVIFWFDI